MPQATEQDKNLGSGEQTWNLRTMLKQYKKITMQTSTNKCLNEHKKKKKTKFKMKGKCQLLYRIGEATCRVNA